MDGWRFEVVQKVIDDGHPLSPIFFLLFIFVASFAVLNLFIALIVDALAEEQKAVVSEQTSLLAEQGEVLEDLEEDAEEAEVERDEILHILKELKQELADIRATVGANK